MSEWISVKDRLPEHLQECLIASGSIVTAATADRKFLNYAIYWDACGFSGHEWEFDFRQDEVTHWQTLPEPPK